MDIRKIYGIDDYEFEKGLSYLSKIQLIRNNSFELSAEVKGSGSSKYLVHILKDSNRELILGECSCPAFYSYDQCKHIAAVLMRAGTEFRSDITKTYFFRPLEQYIHGHEPQVAQTKDDFFEIFDSCVNELEYTQLQGKKDIESFYAPRNNASNIPHKLWFYLEVYQRLDETHVHFQIMCQSKLKSGKLGKIKSIRMDHAIAKLLPNPEDEEMVNKLAPHARWIQNYQTEQNYFDDGHFLLKDNSKLFIDILKTQKAMSLPSYYEESENYHFKDEEVTFSVQINSTNKTAHLYIKMGEKLLTNKDYGGFDYYADAGMIQFVNAFYKVAENSKIPKAIIDMLITFEFEEVEFDDFKWKRLKEVILRHVPHHLIQGDKFNLSEKNSEQEFEIYLKWEEGTSYVRGLVNLKNDLAEEELVIYNDKKFKEFTKFLLDHEIEYDAKEMQFLMETGKTFDLCQFLEERSIHAYFKNQPIKTATNMSMSPSSGIGWLEMNPELQFKEEDLKISDILKKLDLQNNSVPVGNNGIGILPEAWVKRIQKLQQHARLEKGRFKLHPAKALLLDDLTDEKIQEDILSLKSNLQNFTKVNPGKPSKNFTGVLRDYQKLGLGWFEFLEKCSFGGCLADDMGLGKTVQVISYLAKKLTKNKNMKTLIISPKSLVYNWHNEIQKFCPKLNVHVWDAGKLKEEEFEKSHVILVSYPLFQRAKDFNFSFDYLILDEAQMIKNSASLTHKAVASIEAGFKLALTGTPIENHAGDLMSIFNIVIPGLFQAKNIKDPHALEDFGFIQPFLLRRTKEEVLKDLPEKNIQTIYCKQPKAELSEYLKIHQALKIQIESEGVEDNKFNFLQVLTKLRQAACSLQLIDPTSKVGSAKLETLKELVSEIHGNDQKVVIFSQFTKLLKLARLELRMDENNSAYLDGQTKNREEVVEDFKRDPDLKTFFVSIKAGGVGLNLTNASYCIILDPWWNPAVEAQAIDRIHRIGQKNSVFAYRLIAKDTIEEKVAALQNQKRELYDKVLNNNEGFIRNLSPSDIKFLLD